MRWQCRVRSTACCRYGCPWCGAKECHMWSYFYNSYLPRVSDGQSAHSNAIIMANEQSFADRMNNKADSLPSEIWYMKSERRRWWWWWWWWWCDILSEGKYPYPLAQRYTIHYTLYTILYTPYITDNTKLYFQALFLLPSNLRHACPSRMDQSTHSNEWTPLTNE